MNLGGIILCGGQSKRMGRPKAWLPFGPEVMLQRVVRLVSTAVGPLVVVAAPGQDLPELPSHVNIAYDVISGRGPLQGLETGLSSISTTVDCVYLTATDVPFLQPGWVALLADRIEDNDLAIPFIDGFLHPLAAVYRRSSVLPEVRHLLAVERMRPVFLMERLRSVMLSTEDLRSVDAEMGTIWNLNSPDDYQQALRRAGFAPV
jgi:molybdenum cofactor guanylyltransferase